MAYQVSCSCIDLGRQTIKINGLKPLPCRQKCLVAQSNSSSSWLSLKVVFGSLTQILICKPVYGNGNTEFNLCFEDPFAWLFFFAMDRYAPCSHVGHCDGVSSLSSPHVLQSIVCVRPPRTWGADVPVRAHSIRADADPPASPHCPSQPGARSRWRPPAPLDPPTTV